MRKLWKWSIAVLGLVVLFGLVLAPAASAWYPGNNYTPTYRYPTYRYPAYPSYNYGYTYAGCVGCPNYNSGNYSYVYPTYKYPYNYNYNYNYVYPNYNAYPNYNNYAYPNYNNYNYNYSYAQPPLAYNGGGWGSFGTYQNWANAFFSQHGRWPNQQDVNDYWWSQGFARTYGFSPFPY